MEPVNEDSQLRELRRTYHDRIAELRERSSSVLRCAITGTENATTAFLADDPSVLEPMRAGAAEAARVAAAVDDEVVAVLALESPVARDLRLILAARDVTQISLLCVGLALTLAARVGAAGRLADRDLHHHVGRVGTGTADLLRLAHASWATLDPGTAADVLVEADKTRAAQMEFFGALLALTGVPMDAALDLGLSSRAFDRLADHAVEIAERVLFAVHGRHTPVAGP